MTTRTNLKALGFDELEAWVLRLGWPRYRSRQILDWVYHKAVRDFSEMTNLSKPERALLDRTAFISDLALVSAGRSSDGTQKFLFELEDGLRIETVLIPDDTHPRPRLTLCVSSQVGCTLDCQFCLTGRMGLARNLKAHEIVDQVLWVNRYLGSRPGDRPITHIVLMGMGEPLANLAQVAEAIRRLTDPRGLAYSPGRITVSTAGLVPQIAALGRLDLKVNLAVSLNATTDAQRNRLMGTVNQKYPIEALIRACQRVPLTTRRRLTIEYVLIRKENDSDEDARRLVALIRGLRCKVNLIPYNPHPGAPYERPPDERIEGFQQVLRAAGVDAFVRKSRGRDILAACGQLLALDSTPSRC